MAVTHTTSVRNGLTSYVVDLCDAGSPTPGKLIIRATGTVGSPGTEVATLTLSDPAFGAPATGIATAASITSDTSATGGTAATATLEDNASTIAAHCSVTATGGGGDIELSTVTIGAGATVAVSSLTYESAP